jgi:hypothetical protein
MRLRILVYSILLLALLVFGSWAWFSASLYEGRASSSYFHMPAAGCPAGSQSVPDMFKRRDRTVPGCYNPAGDGTIDVLHPGEGVVIQLRPAREVRQ